MEEQTNNIVPVNAARVEHLVHADIVFLKCSCGHKAAAKVSTIKKKLSPCCRIADIEKKFRCTQCDERGSLTINARAALGYDRNR